MGVGRKGTGVAVRALSLFQGSSLEMIVPHPAPFLRAVSLAVLGSTLSWLGTGCVKPKQAPPAPPPPVVTVAKPGSAIVQDFYEYNGYLEAVETVEIRARVKGYLNEVLFTEGDEVKAGDKLYAIDPREFQADVSKAKSQITRAEADIANARAQIKLAQSEFDRLRSLAQSSSISRSDLDKAEANLAATKAQLDVAISTKGSAESALRTSELQLSYTDIRSPIAGRISRTLVSRGNLVGQLESTLLTTIVGMDPIYAYFDVPERDLVEYEKNRAKESKAGVKQENAPLQVGVATEEGYPHAGVIDFRENRVDTGTGTVRLRGRLPNPKGGPSNARVLYPGLFARVRVPRDQPTKRLTIPEDALMTGQEGKFVYVVGPEDKVVKRTVQVGSQVWRASALEGAKGPGWTLVNRNPPPKPVGGGNAAPATPPAPVPVRSMVAIESGLTSEDIIIVSGLQKARPGAPVTPEMWTLEPPDAPQPPKPKSP